MTITFSELANIDLPIYPNSLVEDGEVTYLLARSGDEKRLCVMAPTGSRALAAFTGDASTLGEQTLLVCPPTHSNAAALRGALPWLRPGLFGAAHISRLWRPDGAGNTRPHPSSTGGGGQHRDDLRPAVDPRDDPHRPQPR